MLVSLIHSTKHDGGGVSVIINYIINGRLNTLEGEAMAIKKALIELIQRGFSHVIIESDSQIVIEVIS
jgi:ribonuclease HI